jgi:hypothetical protein
MAKIMDGTSGVTLSLFIGGAIILLLWRVLNPRLDEREPPILKPRIPIIGHLIGMFKYSHAYHRKLL